MPRSTHTLTLIPGDGIGPEVSRAVTAVLDAAGVPIEWDHQDAGVTAFNKTGQTLPAELLDSVTRNTVALKGLRKALDLYANLRPVSNLAGVNARWMNVDLVIVRENTEDLYSGLEHVIVPGVVESLKIITEVASTRIAEFAFRFAESQKRKKVTAVHKANIMKLGDGLFLDSVRAVATRFPGVPYEERIVDAACMHLVMRPEQFDVMVMPNLYGDIVSDLCAGLVGGLGLVPGANLGTDVAVFEAVHGSAPDIAGKDLANPTALLLSALMMLRHIGETEAAARIMTALETVLTAGVVRTRDLGGTSSTTEFTQALCEAIR
jgi:isocitrate dehydrogenase (NAD+)